MQTEGELIIDGKKEKVRGLTWMDHEFGSNQLREDQVGWDWFSIQLDNQYRIDALSDAPKRWFGRSVLQRDAGKCQTA